MERKLYIAGDSFASVDIDQPIGTSWGEILADLLNLKLINVARPGVGNVSIAIQIDYILQTLTHNDYIVVLLTDKYRKLLPTVTDQRLQRPILLSYHTLHDKQKNLSGIDFSKVPVLDAVRNTEEKTKEHDIYFKNYFNASLQQFEDEYILTGAFCKVLKKSNKLIVCSGGFDNAAFHRKNPTKVDCSTFSLSEKNFISFSSIKMIDLGASRYINHISLETHQKMARIFYNKIINDLTPL